MAVLTSFKHLGREQWRVSRRNVCFSFSLCHTRGGRGPSSPHGGLPEASICISVPPAGKPQRPQDPDSIRAPNLPVLSAPHPAWGSSGVGVTCPPPPPTPQPSHSEPAQEKARPLPSRDSWSNSGPAVEAGIRLPPPDPHRHALTELLCLSDPLGSGGYSTARGTGQGAERVYLSSSAGPVEYPSAPPPPASPSSGQAVAAAKATARYRQVTRPRGPCMPRDPVGREGRCLRP